MLVSDFNYHLPEELIAQSALEDRAASRMLVVHRSTGLWQDRTFRDLPEYLSAGDVLVVNDTRVFPARLFGLRAGSDTRVELFLLKAQPGEPAVWSVLARPGRRLRPGTVVELSPALRAEVLSCGERGERTVRFLCEGDLESALEAVGHMPLPPYIHRADTPADRQRYQTVYADRRGSVAAPTAGLHFTPEVLARCQAAGAALARVTLHVGLGTFQPLEHAEVEANRLHTESYEISATAAATLAAARRRVAIGTTSVRVLETAASRGGLHAQSGETNIFIYPGYQFQAVDALLTNFHLPQSSLLMLVSALAGRELTLAAYNYAVSQRYRFFSYGDCMLIL